MFIDAVSCVSAPGSRFIYLSPRSSGNKKKIKRCGVTVYGDGQSETRSRTDKTRGAHKSEQIQMNKARRSIILRGRITNHVTRPLRRAPALWRYAATDQCPGVRFALSINSRFFYLLFYYFSFFFFCFFCAFVLCFYVYFDETHVFK